MAIGIFDVVSDVRKPKLKSLLGWSALIMVIFSTIRTMDSTIYYTIKSKIRFYQKEHYKREYDVSMVHHQLSLLPTDAIVCAHSLLLLHIALRANVYEFPRIKDAEYVVYSNYDQFYITSEEEFNAKTDSLKHTSNREVLYDKEITVLKRIQN
ncbi:MAG: hypothetical protein CL840_09015 [Crocinitomicaceae bacterium]|nr:hypothetical protein [Crocinitomicaceae bacterium]|tara:strand:+ start:10936 stop:11394 length:459 start_codon:yes stop_codon:yes gene_type:complete